MTRDDTQVIIEYFDDKFATLLEGMESTIDRKIQPVAHDVTELKSDVKAIKATVTATNRDLKTSQEELEDHEQRITTLEAA